MALLLLSLTHSMFLHAEPHCHHICTVQYITQSTHPLPILNSDDIVLSGTLRCCLVALAVPQWPTASAAVPPLDPATAAACGAWQEVPDTSARLQDIWDGWGSYPEKIQNCPVSTFGCPPGPWSACLPVQLPRCRSLPALALQSQDMALEVSSILASAAS